MYDLCNFQIATMGFQGTSVNIGELYITYQVSLRKPKLYAALGSYQNFAQFSSINFNNAEFFGSNIVVDSNSNILGLNVQNNVFSFAPPTLPQAYYVNFSWLGAGVVGVQFPVPSLLNGLSIYGTTSTNFPASGTGTTVATQSFIMQYLPADNISGDLATVQMTGIVNLPTSPLSFICYILQVPNHFLNI